MKIFLISFLFIIGTYTSYSQSLGVQAGTRLNLSGIDYPGVEVNRKMGFEGGVFYRYSLRLLPLSLRASMVYFNSEFSLKNDIGNNVGITYHFEEHNLKLPLTVEWRPLPGLIKPFLNAGFYASYSLSGKVKDTDSNNSLKYRNNGHRLNYGAIVGIGVFLTPYIALNANYEYGFLQRDLILGDQFVSVKDRGCSVVVSYLF